MQTPQIFTIEGIQRWNRWSNGRPTPLAYKWWWRWKVAWKVFTGELDALDWTRREPNE